MKKTNWFFIAALFSALAVAMGAFGAHVLKGRLDAYGQSIYSKAVLYQMFHCMGLFVVAILSTIHAEKEKIKNIHLAGFSFLLGIILFSGSLYVLSITGQHWLGMITPFGGLSFLSGWFFIMRYSWTR